MDRLDAAIARLDAAIDRYDHSTGYLSRRESQPKELRRNPVTGELIEITCLAGRFFEDAGWAKVTPD